MGMFHVFVEGPIDEGPEAVRRLAEAMHQRYGLLTSDLIARMSKGRFRVKGNIDDKAANSYRRDLEAIGARVSIEPSDGERDKSGLINLPPMEGRSAEPTPAGGLPRSRATSGAPGSRGSSQKIGPVIERTKQPHDDRRDQLSPRIAATTKAPLGVDRPAAASNPPPLSTTPSSGRGAEPMPSAGVERLGDRSSNVALGAAGPSNAGISVPRSSGVELDLGAPGGHGDVARRNQAVEAGDFDLGAPGPTIPPRYTPVPANAIDLGASGAQPGDRATPPPRTTPVPLGAPGAPYPTGPDGAPLPPRTIARNDAVGRTGSMPPPVRAPAPPPLPPERPARPTPPPLDLEAPRHNPTPPPPPLGPPARPSPSPSLPPPRQAGSFAVPASPAPPTPARPYASGLAAAYSKDAVEQPKDLHLALAALDSNAEMAPPDVVFGGGGQPMMSASIGPAPGQPMMPASIGPPPGQPMMPASIGPAALPARPTPAPPGQPPRAHDPFAPPDAHEQELRVDLAPDDRPRPVPARPSAPSTPMLQRKPVAAPKLGVTTLAPTLPRWHFAAGVAACIVLGFIPAHLVASMREASADKAIDDQVIEEQNKADTLDRYNALDSMRAAQESRKKSEHRNIALVSLLIWAAAGAGVGYLWFRKIPWDKVLKT